MSVEGQLMIRLFVGDKAIRCKLSSSRPLHASRLFAGKAIDEVLKTIPMLFNICGKAQTIAALRSAESSLNQEVDEKVEAQREALIWLESLREQLWRILLEYPSYLDETVDSKLIASINQNILTLTHDINRNQSLLRRFSIQNEVTQQKTWHQLKKCIETDILGKPSHLWLDHKVDIKAWADCGTTLTARFSHWLQQQTWQHAGTSKIQSLSTWDDAQLQQQLNNKTQTLTHLPVWNKQPHEVSWFSLQQQYPFVIDLLNQWGNGIYTRVMARVIGVADLLQKLNSFFLGEKPAIQSVAKQGMAHVNAARGRLTHCIQMAGETVQQLTILAPTEWNFHPRGVAATGLENLQGKDTKSLEQQAHCLIHAIDPCVGYQLSIIKV